MSTTTTFRQLHTDALKNNEPFLVIKYFGRPLAFPLVLLFSKTPLTANQITLLGGFSWAIGMGSLLFVDADNHMKFGVAAIFLLLGGVLDIVDGGIARIRKTFSMSGAYLDFVLHHVFNPALAVCIGYFLSNVHGIAFLALGIAAVPGSWGFSQTAKQCILLKNRRLVNRSDQLNERDYHTLFFDPSEVLQPISDKPSLVEILKKLPSEFFFPGNFFTFPAAMALDLIFVNMGFSFPYPTLTLLFTLYAGALALSIPFRIKREFETLLAEDRKIEHK